MAELQRKIDASGQNDGQLKWVVNPLRRHQYAAIPFTLPWHAAKAFAEANGGHLVVINNKEENDWLVSTFGGDTEYWTGLTDEAEEGKWKAVNGETVEYFNQRAGAGQLPQGAALRDYQFEGAAFEPDRCGAVERRAGQ